VLKSRVLLLIVIMFVQKVIHLPYSKSHPLMRRSLLTSANRIDTGKDSEFNDRINLSDFKIHENASGVCLTVHTTCDLM
jgi:hypothetical protein